MLASKRIIFACLIAFTFLAVAPASVLGQSGGGFVYTATGNGNRVQVFTIDPSSGALTPVPRGLFTTGADPRWITTDPTAHFLYVANAGGSNISTYSIDGTTGGLSLVLGAPYGAPWAPLAVAFDPVGNFVYATDNIDPLAGAGSILVYTVNGNGALKAFPSSPIPQNYIVPNTITVASNTRSVYVTGCHPGQEFDGCNGDPGVVFAFTIGPQGAPQPMPGSPFQVGAHPISIALDPQQQFLYVANLESANLSVFSIDGMGALTPVAGSPFATDRLPSSVQVTGAGQFVYVGTNQGFVDAYAVNRSTGALTPVPGSPFRHQNPFTGFACGADLMAVDPSRRFLYTVPNGNNSFSGFSCVYQIDGTSGALTFGSQFSSATPRSIIATAGPQ